MSSSARNSTSSSSAFRVNYNDYVADITGSPKTVRKLPSNGTVTGIGHHINPLHNPYPKEGNRPADGMPHYGGSAEKCARCSQSVYLAEKRVGAGRSFHIRCFSCHTCKRKLDATTLSEHKGEIYCKACYTREFGVHGLVSGVTMTTQTPRRESRPGRRSSIGNDLDAPVITHQSTRPRAHSNDDILHGELDAVRHDEVQRFFPWRDEVLPDQYRGPKKADGVEIPVERRPTRPASQTDYQRMSENDARHSTYYGEDNRRNYIVEGEKVPYDSGASAFVNIPVVVSPTRTDRTTDFVVKPSTPSRYDERSRSPSPVSPSGSFGRQNSHERYMDTSEDFSRMKLNDDPRGSRYSSGNMTDAMATENPLVKETYYRSSSHESKRTSTTSNGSNSVATNLDRQSSRSRDSPQSVAHANNRSPSPTSGYVSPSTTYTSPSTRNGSQFREPTSPPAYGSQHDYLNRQASTSSQSNAVNRHPVSPHRSDRAPSAIGTLASQTRNFAPNMSPTAGGTFNVLGALVQPIRPSSQLHNHSDDDFDN